MKVPDQSRRIEEQDEDVLLAMLVWGEARGEPPEGRLAVAYVPITRLSRGAGGATSLRRVMMKRWQFSCFNEGDPNRHKLLRPVEYGGLGPWVACWRAAVAALTAQSENPAPGATHYCVRRLWARPAADASRPKWFELPLIQRGITTKVAEIGSHVFARTT